jgi:hypothetical protein
VTPGRLKPPAGSLSEPRVTLNRLLAASRASNYPAPNGVPRAEPPRRKGRGYPPLSEMSDAQRGEFHEALLEVGSFEDLPGKWQAAILKAEQNRPKLRVITRN